MTGFFKNINSKRTDYTGDNYKEVKPAVIVEFPEQVRISMRSLIDFQYLSYYLT